MELVCVLRGWRRWSVAVVAVVIGAAGTTNAFAEETPATAAQADTGDYAPLDREGPALSVPAAELAAAVTCTKNVAGATRDPILLVPGTGLNPRTNFSWNYVRAFDAAKRPWCSVALPGNALGDIQVAGEYVVHALRHISALSGRKVDVLGFSQGGMVPRWALRFWPDTRALVDDVIGLAPSNHGTADAEICVAVCGPALWQQRATSPFIRALNSGAETFGGIDYTAVYTRLDEVVIPNLDARYGSSSLRTGSGRITNVATQDICPVNLAEHLSLGSYDAVGYAVAMDALDHAGPASASRVSRSVCGHAFHPGVNPLTFVRDYADYTTSTVAAVAAYPMVSAEPALRPYVFARP
jgi:triacylglycerol esterase/lipase EstA (alpha/beta hydrolase family)